MTPEQIAESIPANKRKAVWHALGNLLHKPHAETAAPSVQALDDSGDNGPPPPPPKAQ